MSIQRHLPLIQLTKRNSQEDIPNLMYYQEWQRGVSDVANQKKTCYYLLEERLRSKTTSNYTSLFFNSFAVGMFIRQTYYDADHMEFPFGWNLVLKLILSLYFAFDLITNIMDSHQKLGEIFKFTSIMDIITIMMIVHDMYDDIFFYSKNHIEDRIISMLLSLRIIKTRDRIRDIIYQTNTDRNPDKVPKVISKNEIIRIGLFTTLTNILCLIVINTAFILFVDELSDNQLLKSFNKKNPLKFHNAMYFQIITMTTIGYGDIFPVNVQGRVIVTIFILICAVLFTQWFSTLLDLISKKKPLNTRQSELEMTVVYGNICQEDDQTQKFLQYFYTNRFSKKIQKFSRLLTFISEDPPNHDLNAYIKFENLQSNYGISKISTIAVGSFFSNLNWFKEAQLEKAKAFICFFTKRSGKPYSIFERNLIDSISLIQRSYPHIKIYLNFESENIISETRLFSKDPKLKRRICVQKYFRNQLASTAIENRGVGTLLSILLSNQEKIKLQTQRYMISMKSENKRLYDFYLGSQSQFWVQNFTEGQVDKFFTDLAFQLYFYQYPDLDYQEEHDKFSPVLLIGVKRKINGDVMIFPQGYQIQLGDKAIFISNSNQAFLNFVNNDITNTTIINEAEIFNPEGEQIIENLFTNHQRLQESLSVNFTKFEIMKIDFFYQKFSLKDDKVENHIILAGIELEELGELIAGIRDYNEFRIITYFTEENLEDMHQFIPAHLHKNLFLIKGSYQNISHLHRLNLRKAYRVIARFPMTLNSVVDTQMFHFYRLFQEIDTNGNVLIELADDAFLNFLDMRCVQNDLNIIYWPHSISGRLINDNQNFISLSILGYFHKPIAHTLLNLFGIQHMNLMHQDRQKMRFLTLKVTISIAKSFKNFGDLQYHLLQNPKLRAIAVGYIKQQGDNNQYNKSIEEKVNLEFYNYQTLIINPHPFNGFLEQGDEVIVVGDLNGIEKRWENITKQTSENKLNFKKSNSKRTNLKEEKRLSQQEVENLQKKIDEQNVVSDQIINLLQSYNTFLHSLTKR